jgi:hypothetical protein
MKTFSTFLTACAVLLCIGWVTVVPNSGTSSGGGLPGDGTTIGTNSATQLTVTNAVAILVDGATITPNATVTNCFKVTLGGNRTIANPTGGYDMQVIMMKFKQDGTGGRTVSWGAKYHFNDTIPDAVLSTTASVFDVIWWQYFKDEDIWVPVNFKRNNS